MYIFCKNEKNKEKLPIILIHRRPDLMSDEQKKKGIEIESLEKKPKKEGYKQLPYYNAKTGEAWYEYVKKE